MVDDCRKMPVSVEVEYMVRSRAVSRRTLALSFQVTVIWEKEDSYVELSVYVAGVVF